VPLVCDVAYPFYWWISNRRVSDAGEELWICAVLEVATPFSAEETIRRYYPDAKVSFCEVPPDWWSPSQSISHMAPVALGK